MKGILNSLSRVISKGTERNLMGKINVPQTVISFNSSCSSRGCNLFFCLTFPMRHFYRPSAVQRVWVEIWKTRGKNRSSFSVDIAPTQSWKSNNRKNLCLNGLLSLKKSKSSLEVHPSSELNDSLTNKRLTSDTEQLLVRRSKGDIRTETVFRLENVCQWRQSKKSLFFSQSTRAVRQTS